MLRSAVLTTRSLLALKPRQLLMLVWRRGLQPRFQRRPAALDTPAFDDALMFWFLNRGRVFAPGEFNWQAAGEHRLWIYNLHYFGYLNDTAYPLAQQLALIEHWIAASPRGYGPGWEPYPTSLRLVNWLRWRDRNGGDVAEASESWASIDTSIREQADWLSRHLETHILANHYFENLKALVFVAAILGGRAGRFRQARLEMKLLRELGEQFLDDGGHYERSPSYHCLLLDGLLDILELDRLRPGVLDGGFVAATAACASRALTLLAVIELPGDRYPLFNDSAFDAAPRPSQLFSRAHGLDLSWTSPASAATAISLPAFGIYGWRDPQAGDLRIKCGAVGPDYQPGHTHCDMLSFEWYLDGEPVIVDTGVYEYEPGPMRQYVRSTAAHNTVSVDEVEQSEIWGEFRVARRATVIAADMVPTAMGARFEGAIRAFPGIRGGIVHHRVIERASDARGCTVTVEDRVQGRGQHRLASSLLFHPDIQVEAGGQGVWCVKRGERLLVRLLVPADCAIEWRSAPYCPEFGVRRDSRQLVMRREAVLPASMSYTFELETL